MQCNINAKGKAVRLVSGLLFVLIAAVLAVLVLAGVLVSGGWWVVVVAAMGGGVFMIFEGWSGWCVVRAMGLKTPI